VEIELYLFVIEVTLKQFLICVSFAENWEKIFISEALDTHGAWQAEMDAEAMAYTMQ
jgi:hypothetical protein